MLFGKTDIKPQCVLGGFDILALFERHRAQERLLNEIEEVCFWQPHQLAIHYHAHCCVPTRAGNEGLFAERFARPEHRQTVIRRLCAGGTRHLATALGNDVVVVASPSLLDDDIAFRHFDRFQKAEYALDVRGRELREKLRLQDASHPIAVVISVYFGNFDVPVIVTNVRRGDLVEQISLHSENGRVTLCACRHFARLQLG